MSIRKATPGEAPAITDMLNRATFLLHKKGIMQWDFPWHEEHVIEQIRNRISYIGYYAGQAAASFLLHRPLSPEERHYTGADPDCLYLSQLVLAPEFQGRGLGREPLLYAAQQAASQNQNLYLDCWFGSKKLKSFYSSFGFLWVRDYPEKDYQISLYCFPTPGNFNFIAAPEFDRYQ